MFTINNTSLLETVEYTIKTLDDNNGVYTVNKVPSKEGFEFLGWVVSSDDTPRKSFTFSYDELGDKHYYAKWNANVTYTITLENINLDYVTYDGKQYPVEGNNESSITISYDGDDIVEIKEPTRIGHTFNGWYDEANNPMGKSFTLKAGTIGDKVYSASWEAIKYTITYNGLEGATNHQSNVNEYYITDTPITLYAPSKPHFDFGGWKTANNETVTSIAKGTTGNITLTATWAEKTYSIKYENLLNATFENGETNPTSYKITTKNLSLYNPARVGYDFTGWTSEQLTYDSNTKLFTIKQESYGKEIVIEANWEAISYDITYELGTNGVNNGNNPNSYTIESSFTLQSPTRSGYTFVRWEKDGNAVTGISTGNIGEVTFTAIWTANPYNIEYVLNGGTKAENTPTIYTPDENTSIPNPTKDGYEFEGWTVKDSLGNEIAELTGKDITIHKDSISGDLSFTANWSQPINYSISYTLNGGEVSGNPTTYTVETATFELKMPTKEGFEFIGWTGSNGETANKEVSIEQGSTGNRSYTAHFEPTNYSITYNLNGGTNNSSNPESYTIEDGDITLLAPTRTGYTFLGWTGSNGTTPTIDVKIHSGSTGNKEYTANWEAITYTVNFDTDGGNEIESQTISYNGKVTKPTDPVKVDYIFAGWFIGEDEYDFNTVVTSDLTLTAKWVDTSLSIEVIEINYNSSYRTWKDIYDNLLADAIIFKNSSGEVISLTLGVDYEIIAISDNERDWTTYPNSLMVGNTYIATINMINQNYHLINTDVQFKYKTVKIGEEWFTIEDALSESGTSKTLILAGNETNYVETTFTSFSNIYNSKEFTLNGGTLVVSADGSSNGVLSSSLSDVVYSLLTIPSDITLKVTNGGTLTVSGQIGNYSKVTRRGVIMNDGTIDVESGTLNAYGFVKSSSSSSNGIVIIRTNSTAVDCMRIFDWPGGNTANNVKKKTLPTNAWSIHNISCTIKLEGYATYKIRAYVQVSITEISGDYAIINGTSSEKPLFRSSSENSYIIKTATSINDELYTVSGSNQVMKQKDIINIYGDYSDSTFEISKSGYTLGTSTSVICPIGYMDVIVSSGTLSLSKSDYLFYPGTKMEVKESASLVISSGVDVSFETMDNINYVESNATGITCLFNSSKWASFEDAKLFLSGNLTLNGKIGGTIIPGKENVSLNLSGKTLNTSYTALKHAVGSGSSGFNTYTNNNLPLIGYITSNESSIPNEKLKFINQSYTSIMINNSFYWLGEQGTKLEAGTGIKPDENTECLVEGTLITMADGTKKKVEDIVPGDMLLIFNHETGKYDVAPVLFNDSEEISNYTVINLVFSDGTIIKVVSEHGFFDLDLMKYVYIDEINHRDFIGHQFYYSDIINNSIVDGKVTLVDSYITTEYTRVYSPVTKYHLNYFTNNLLSMPGGIEGLFNIFEYDENLKYDEEKKQNDIETYGLYTYEDFKDLVSFEIYESFPANYFAVAIGKGLLTWDDIYYYIERYTPLM